jgi:hypothetical protein
MGRPQVTQALSGELFARLSGANAQVVLQGHTGAECGHNVGCGAFGAIRKYLSGCFGVCLNGRTSREQGT